ARSTHPSRRRTHPAGRPSAADRFPGTPPLQHPPRQGQGGAEPKGSVPQQQKTFVLREPYLQPPPPSLTPERIGALDRHLTGVIDSRIRGVMFDGREPRKLLRYPPVGILHEVPGQHVWFPVPGMYGGFEITLRQDFLDVKSRCRVVGGSGQAHVITTAGAILVDEEF